jgi:hypothetical protein
MPIDSALPATDAAGNLVQGKSGNWSLKLDQLDETLTPLQGAALT